MIEINYNDLSYPGKRKLFRQYYKTNPSVYKAVRTLAFEIKKNLTTPIIKELLSYTTIISYLTDGYLSFINVSDDTYIQVDPASLNISYESGKKVWKQFQVDDYKVFDYEDVIFIPYYNDELSFVEPMYKGIINPNDIDFVVSHVDYVVQAFSDYNRCINLEKVLYADESIKRHLKIKRLNGRWTKK